MGSWPLWPWPLAWTSLLSLVITPENFMMIRWEEHCQKGVTDRQTDRQTDRGTEITVLRAAWSQLKMRPSIRLTNHWRKKKTLGSNFKRWNNRPTKMLLTEKNKANLRDLIAVTSLVILLKLDSNRRFFSPCDLEIWWMPPKNNRASLLCYFKLFA